MNEPDSRNQPAPIPTARVQRRRRLVWPWVIPVIALVLAAGLFINYGLKTGPVITITFSSGEGIRAGDLLRCRGIAVGQVEQVRLAPDLDGVAVSVRLDPAARDVARAGSRFWVVRPQIGPRGVAGLETLAGPRYLNVSPGSGEAQDRFVGLDQPPVVERLDAAGLEITLVADRQGGLAPGAAVLYRGIPIGAILSVGLASDATSVEARAYIRPVYTDLVRDDSRFWNVSGAELDLGLRGLRFEIESLMALLDGGVAMATPELPGEQVRTGHRFTLVSSADGDWLAWRPALAVGAELLPPGAVAPPMLRVAVSQPEGLLRLTRSRRGWLLLTGNGLLGPADLLDVQDQAEVDVAGQRIPVEEATARADGRLATLDWISENLAPWPAERMRTMDDAEECVIIADPSEPARPLAAAHLRAAAKAGTWAVSPVLSFPADLHGAAILSREDGALVGLLLVHDGRGTIAPVTE